jgi:hypothetical protein
LTAVTAMIAVIAVIAGFVVSGPIRAAHTVAKGGMTPVTAVIDGRLHRDLRAGRDRRDSSRSSRSHGGHGLIGREAHVISVIISTRIFFAPRLVFAAV